MKDLLIAIAIVLSLSVLFSRLRDNHPIICEEDYEGHSKNHYLSGVMKYSEIHYAYIPYLNDDPAEFLYCQNPNSTSVMYLYYSNGNAEIYQDG